MHCQRWCYEHWPSSMCGCSRVASPTEKSRSGATAAAAAVAAASTATVGAVAAHAVTHGEEAQSAQRSPPEATDDDAAAASVAEVESDGDAAGIVVPESALEQVPTGQNACSLCMLSRGASMTCSTHSIMSHWSSAYGQLMTCRCCCSSQIALWEEYSCKLEQRVHALTHENDTLQRQIAGVQDTLAAAGGTSLSCILPFTPAGCAKPRRRSSTPHIHSALWTPMSCRR